MLIHGLHPDPTRRVPPARRPSRGEVAPVVTPTGRRVAGFGRRVPPFAVDAALCVALWLLAGRVWESVWGSTGVAGVPLAPAAEAARLVAGLVLVWWGPWLLVHVAAPALTGTTPGKAMLGLELVTWSDGSRPSVPRLLGRLGAATALGLVPFGTVVDHLLPPWQRRWATVHDLAAGTAVVHRVRGPGRPR